MNPDDFVKCIQSQINPPYRKTKTMTKAIVKICKQCNGIGKVTTVNGKWIREIRKSSGMSLRKVASKLGLSAMYICDMEHGRRKVSLKLIKWADGKKNN